MPPAISGVPYCCAMAKAVAATAAPWEVEVAEVVAGVLEAAPAPPVDVVAAEELEEVVAALMVLLPHFRALQPSWPLRSLGCAAMQSWNHRPQIWAGRVCW